MKFLNDFPELFSNMAVKEISDSRATTHNMVIQ